MDIKAEEKILILGALFHDIGKFEQRCTGNPKKMFHQSLGKELINSGRFQHRFEAIIGKEHVDKLINIVSEHHTEGAGGFTKYIQEADHISASERVKKEEVEYYKDQWKNKHLCSLFSKINLLSEQRTDLRYYRHRPLSKLDYDVLIPKLEKDALDEPSFSYNEGDWESFKDDLEAVLDFYHYDTDFNSLINLILIVFEKYLWCIPDFTGSSETDISLYNHLKDVTGLAHAIYLTDKDHNDSSMLNLIIGDIPGIQDYIFDVTYTKPAKILRGRSIFVQILVRNIASVFLDKLQLTEANLIMLAGGKFYIVAPNTKLFAEKFAEIKKTIEDYFIEEFRMELSCNCTYEAFNYIDLKNGKTTFGNIIENATAKLQKDKHKVYENYLFGRNEYKNFIRKEEYIDNIAEDTNSIKCRVTDKPIRKNRKALIEDLIVDKQVKIEYEIGSRITGNNIIVEMEENGLSIDPKNINRIKSYSGKSQDKNNVKLLLNPTIDVLKRKDNKMKDVFRNFSYIEAANYCSPYQQDEDEEKIIMPFDEISDSNDGAKYLALIKGDIDNLGLIMAQGLSRDEAKVNDDIKDMSGISRTTTLSNHLKYFFSFYLNGVLKDWELKAKDNLTYTVFAGGDDLMLLTPQSSAVKLIKFLNDRFTEFTCCNKEVHISYSITQFKHDTPIRIISEIAEQNQELCKEKANSKEDLIFTSDKNKASIFIFDTVIKNDWLEDFLKKTADLTTWVNDPKINLSHGLLRKLLDASEAIKKYENTKDASYLIWHAQLTYSVNRLLKDKNNKYRNEIVGKFFDGVLSIRKNEQLDNMLYPIVCQVIYNIR